MVRVELGKTRCRFHGGLSTGPKTKVGRARIAEAQRRRWRAFRDARQGNVINLPPWRDGIGYEAGPIAEIAAIAAYLAVSLNAR